MAADIRGADRVALVDRLTAAFAEEIDRHDAGASIAWPQWSDVRALVAHLGTIHRWVAHIVVTGSSVSRDAFAPAGDEASRAWYEEGRVTLVSALERVPASTPCWILGDRAGTAAFWARRMVMETVKHLTDIRAAGGGTWRIAAELSAEDYADGIDELFAEFLPRSRPDLVPLPGSVLLRAADLDRAWAISPRWAVGEPGDDDSFAAQLIAPAGDLALFLWERANPLRDPVRFRVDGDARVIAALGAAAIHP